MKSNELMIDDWVFYIGDGEPKIRKVLDITALKQVELFDGKDWSSWFLVGEKYIEPIPLTPEILLKIGFCTSRKNSMHGYYTGKYNDSLFRCEYMKPTAQSGKVLGIQFLGECGYVSKTFNLPLPKYLHELQHAFKLCGIDNDIEL